jgi:hypothetical protein
VTYIRNPDTPLIGIRLPIIPHVICPDQDEDIPLTACMGCELYDHTDFSPDAITCNFPDHNRGLRSALRNKENIIAAVIRGGSGEFTRCDARGEVYEVDMP